MAIKIRPMTMNDYAEVYALWMTIKGFGIRSIDDSREGIERFLRRNPNTSVVAAMDGKLVGSILCGHDGRQGGRYHVWGDASYRQHGIGRKLVAKAIEALKAEQINKVYLIAFTRNEGGNAFWKKVGWQCQDDRNYYDLNLNEANMTVFNE